MDLNVVVGKEMARVEAAAVQALAGCVGEKYVDFVSIKLITSIIRMCVS
tara:strand:- start:100 stop:246 length:147 start_codon:yes stop_codon:yes gene_type:complete